MNNFQNSGNIIIITPKVLKEAFKLFCIDQKYLSLQSFNNALNYLFKPPIPKIQSTFLSQKIFNIIDPNKSGQIDENTFYQTFANILKDRNYRILLSMRAMMNIPDNNRNYLQIYEIKNFMFNSYIEGFKILGNMINLNKEELLKNNFPLANVNQLVNWAKSCETKFYNELDNDIKLLNNNLQNELDYGSFMKWISVDHNLYLQYGFIYLPIATSLIVLDKIKFDDTEFKKMIPEQNSNNNNANNNIKNNNDKKNNSENLNNNKANNNKNSGKKNTDVDTFGFEVITKDFFDFM